MWAQGISIEHLTGRKLGDKRLAEALHELAAGNFHDPHPNRMVSKTRLAEMFFDKGHYD